MFYVYAFLLALTPIIMMLVGCGWKKFPPKTPNGYYGYRSAMSMKSQATWDFAQQEIAKIWFKVGVILLLPTYISLFLFRNTDKDTLGIAVIIIVSVQLFAMMFPMYFVEKALKRLFHKDGSKKE